MTVWNSYDWHIFHGDAAFMAMCLPSIALITLGIETLASMLFRSASVSGNWIYLVDARSEDWGPKSWGQCVFCFDNFTFLKPGQLIILTSSPRLLASQLECTVTFVLSPWWEVSDVTRLQLKLTFFCEAKWDLVTIIFFWYWRMM